MFVCIVRFHCIFHHFATVECSTVLKYIHIVHIYMIQCHHVHRTIEVSTDDMLYIYIIFTYHLFLAIMSVIGSIMSQLYREFTLICHHFIHQTCYPSLFPTTNIININSNLDIWLIKPNINLPCFLRQTVVD